MTAAEAFRLLRSTSGKLISLLIVHIKYVIARKGMRVFRGCLSNEI